MGGVVKVTITGTIDVSYEARDYPGDFERRAVEEGRTIASLIAEWHKENMSIEDLLEACNAVTVEVTP